MSRERSASCRAEPTFVLERAKFFRRKHPRLPARNYVREYMSRLSWRWRREREREKKRRVSQSESRWRTLNTKFSLRLRIWHFVLNAIALSARDNNKGGCHIRILNDQNSVLNDAISINLYACWYALLQLAPFDLFQRILKYLSKIKC